MTVTTRTLLLIIVVALTCFLVLLWDFWLQRNNAPKFEGGWQLVDDVDMTTQCDLIEVYESKEGLMKIREMMRSRLPFVIRNSTSVLARRDVWERSNLLNKFGDRKISAESESSIVSGGGSASSSSTLRKVIESMRSCQKINSCSDGFVFDPSIMKSIPDLSSDIDVPSYFKDWDNRQNEQQGKSWRILSLGPANTGLPMHSHGKTWLAVAYGVKRWYLYPPGSGFPSNFSRNYSMLQSVSQWQESAMVDMKGFLPPVTFDSQRLQMKWSTKIAGSFRPLQCEQRAGDIIYLPDGWSHLTINSAETIAYGGQAAFLPQERYNFALGMLHRDPNDFEMLKNAATGIAHMTIDHHQRMQATQRFGAMLVFNSQEELVTFAADSLDIIIRMRIVQKDGFKSEHGIHSKDLMTVMQRLAERYIGKANFGMLVDDLQYLRTSRGMIYFQQIVFGLDSKPILRSTITYSPVSSTDVLTLLEEVDAWMKGVIHVYYLPEVHSVHATTLGTKQLLDEAKDYLKRALAIRPSHLECWRLLAEVTGSLGLHEEMRMAVNDALHIFDRINRFGISDQAYASVYHQLATSFLSVQLGADALPLLKKALSIKKNYLPAMVDRLVAAYLAKDKQKAKNYLTALHEYDSKHTSLAQLGKMVQSMK